MSSWSGFASAIHGGASPSHRQNHSCEAAVQDALKLELEPKKDIVYCAARHVQSLNYTLRHTLIPHLLHPDFTFLVSPGSTPSGFMWGGPSSPPPLGEALLILRRAGSGEVPPAHLPLEALGEALLILRRAGSGEVPPAHLPLEALREALLILRRAGSGEVPPVLPTGAVLQAILPLADSGGRPARVPSACTGEVCLSRTPATSTAPATPSRAWRTTRFCRRRRRLSETASSTSATRGNSRWMLSCSVSTRSRDSPPPRPPLTPCTCNRSTATWHSPSTVSPMSWTGLYKPVCVASIIQLPVWAR